MHVADHRLDRLDHLAVDLGDQAQHPVRRRVLWTQVERHIRGLELDGHLDVAGVDRGEAAVGHASVS
jgi:hypothetical protein